MKSQAGVPALGEKKEKGSAPKQEQTYSLDDLKKKFNALKKNGPKGT
jgi:hypothetical protein